ncbi:uncharacterized protein RSE6_13318 [Rhynchosporium secalis]|uniref:RING-type domain-containing protein n=1 Tax=Rhynchosporium secalis TaxID=38038 RepID=A0A1E1MSL1_RHYSE|nr:uncharacterized protein RSE6_13318 [Rhynchosporium secalis]
MSYHPFRSYAAAPESLNEFSAQGRPEVANSHSNIDRQDSTSPYGLFASDQAADEPSPWSVSSSGNDYDTLTLPPINPDNNYNDLPSFDDAPYFDALPRIQSPNPFLPGPSTLNTNSRPQSRSSQDDQEPPPSNQQQRREPPPVSQYRVAVFESPDPFEDLDLDFADLSSLLDERPSGNSTRRSSFVDLTSSPDMAPTTRKRKATEPGRGRSRKVTKSASKTSRPTSAAGTRAKSEVHTIDLVDIDDKAEYEERMAKEQAETIKKQNQAAATRSVKLAEFQCIICMDNPTDLTVTFCGHLFCSECLHQALYAGEKKCCPVCRSNISSKKTAAGKQPKNGAFALEMKFMTAKKKGKQPAQG